MHCTQCGAEGAGRFCAACGASLQSIQCTRCHASIAPGTRFCTNCGAPARGEGGTGGAGSTVAAGMAGAGSASAKLGWWVAGGLLVVILLAVVIERFGGGSEGETAGTTAGTSGLGPTANVDLSSMSPREAADRLFSRVMSAIEQGNSAEASSFLPMAIDAYGLARPLDEDGLYHLALLQGAAAQFTESLATAREGLERAPEHLLLLSAAGDAAFALDDEATATEYYTLLLEAWDREMALGRLEYTDHSRILPLVREDAETYLEGR